MIELPRRSVTRFFIPLIDVLTLLFCIFLLMPIVKATGERSEQEPSFDERASASQRQEWERLREARRILANRDRLQQDVADLERQTERLRKEKLETIESRLAIRVLEIGDDGRLIFYDSKRAGERRQEITKENVRDFIESQKQTAGAEELFFLFLYPRPATGNPLFPLRSQREEFDRWFAGFAHGYDVPSRGR